MHKTNIFEFLLQIPDWQWRDLKPDYYLPLLETYQHRNLRPKGAFQHLVDVLEEGAIGEDAELFPPKVVYRNLKAFKMFTAIVHPGHYEQSVTDRFRPLLEASAYPLTQEVLRHHIWKDGIARAEDLVALEEDGQPLLPKVALQIGLWGRVWNFISPFRARIRRRKGDVAGCTEWKSLVRECVQASCDVHYRRTYSNPPLVPGKTCQVTPLMEIVTASEVYPAHRWPGYYVRSTNGKKVSFLNDILHAWLKALAVAGVDLEAYGRRE